MLGGGPPAGPASWGEGGSGGEPWKLQQAPLEGEAKGAEQRDRSREEEEEEEGGGGVGLGG